jgi:hemolysin D
MTSGSSRSSRRNPIRNPFRPPQPPSSSAAETLPGFDSNLVEVDPLNPGSPPPPSQRPPAEEQRPRGYRRRRTTLPRSTRGWSRAVVWSLIGLTAFSVIYGFSAQLDSSITTTGQLRPKGGVSEVMTPFNTLFAQVLVKEGQQVKAGDLLVVLRDKPILDQLKGSRIQQGLWRKRIQLTAQQLGLPTPKDGLAETERQLNVERTEVELRSLAAAEENRRIRINRQQAEADLLGLKQRLIIEKSITARMDKLLLQGAISKLEVDRQHARLSELQSTKRRAELEVASARRRELEGKYKYNYINLADAKQLYTNYDNARQSLIDANNRVKDLEERLRLSNVRAPSAGMIFDLNARVGEMAVSGRPILQIVPKTSLTAEILIANKDVGWIKVGMPVEVRINSFPFTEYGSLKGVLESISEDSYPPDNVNPQDFFKGKVKLNKSVLSHYGTDYKLRPGMSITALVQVGSRPAISLVSDRFIGFVDSARSIR